MATWLGVLATLAFALFNVNMLGWTSDVGGHLRSIREYILKVTVGRDDARIARKLREQTVQMQLWASEATIHTQLAITCGLLFQAVVVPTIFNLSHLVLYGVLYVQSLELVWKRESVSVFRLHTMYVAVWLVLVFRALLAGHADMNYYSTIHQIDMLLTVAIGVSMMDIKAAAPFLIPIFLADAWSLTLLSGSGLCAVSITTIFRLLLVLSLCAVIEHLFRLYTASELDTQIALLGFRGMVRGSMDADVMLDSQLRIRDKPSGLEQLLERPSLAGTCFLDLLPSDDCVHSFLQFIAKASAQTAASPVNLVPPAIRLGLKRASGGQARADAFLVHLPSTFDREELYLLGLKEDAQASDEPEPLHSRRNIDSAAVAQAARRFRLASSASASSVPTSSVYGSQHPTQLTSWPEMVDMNIFLDGQTEWFDINEVRIRFARLGEAHSGMPNLRRLLHPQEWKALRPKMRQFVWNAFDRSSEFVPQELGPLHVRVPSLLPDGDRSFLANGSQLSLVRAPNINRDGLELSAQPVFFCMQLYNFECSAPADLGTGTSDLESISEASNR